MKPVRSRSASKAVPIPPAPALPALASRAKDFSPRSALPAFPALPWLTVERAVYALLVLLALVLRVIDLGGRPLAPAEAGVALQAWQASQGLSPALDAGTPLLFTLQSLTFWLTGAGDAAVRFWPYLASVALPLAFYALRASLGQITALLAAVLLTFSPLVNAFGRRGDGVTLLLMALGLCLAGWSWRQRHAPAPRNPAAAGWLLAVGFALLLLSGPAAPTALLGLLVIVALHIFRGTQQDDHLPRDHRIRLAAAASQAGGMGYGFLAALLLGGTAFLTQVRGLGMVALDWSAWLAAWTFAPAAWLWGAVRLLSDEPLLLPFGLAAVIWTWRRADLTAVLAKAGLAAALIAILQGPNAAGSRAVAAFLLAAPAADLLQRLLRGIYHHFVPAAPDKDIRDGENTAESYLFMAVQLLLVTILVLGIFRYIRDGADEGLLLTGLAFVMAVLLFALFRFFLGARAVLNVAMAVVLVSMALFNLSTLSALAFDRGSPRFPAVYAQDARPGARDLAQVIGDLSQQQNGMRTAQAVLMIADGAPASADITNLIHWYLRAFPNLQIAGSASLETAPGVVVAPADRELALTERYAGQPFAISSVWQPLPPASPREFLRWLFFRSAPYVTPTTDVILWADHALLSLAE